jgi:hypothetical protein
MGPTVLQLLETDLGMKAAADNCDEAELAAIIEKLYREMHRGTSQVCFFNQNIFS